ncbi:hypothetical protein EIN_015010 [Entamoeba invadens IP1]|uniref:hypothetical protein n=1 Tax=Entamoeba invadens IP1 TaxID=370355 RepID=UPI0002C3E15B|nr:hypothetical protein EIN_015010 [Entamoeba invadens IP1]ELP90372.1 hypothetical protein EIN_015010 [Entamoeba invadens IP1]|eukprot:XP_004257143.1 hypothetical protein EIN_015010 [Entamoeba invadens IP1]
MSKELTDHQDELDESYTDVKKCFERMQIKKHQYVSLVQLILPHNYDNIDDNDAINTLNDIIKKANSNESICLDYNKELENVRATLMDVVSIIQTHKKECEERRIKIVIFRNDVIAKLIEREKHKMETEIQINNKRKQRLTSQFETLKQDLERKFVSTNMSSGQARTEPDLFLYNNNNNLDLNVILNDHENSTPTLLCFNNPLENNTNSEYVSNLNNTDFRNISQKTPQEKDIMLFEKQEPIDLAPENSVCKESKERSEYIQTIGTDKTHTASKHAKIKTPEIVMNKNNDKKTPNSLNATDEQTLVECCDDKINSETEDLSGNVTSNQDFNVLIDLNKRPTQNTTNISVQTQRRENLKDAQYENSKKGDSSNGSTDSKKQKRLFYIPPVSQTDQSVYTPFKTTRCIPHLQTLIKSNEGVLGEKEKLCISEWTGRSVGESVFNSNTDPSSRGSKTFFQRITQCFSGFVVVVEHENDVFGAVVFNRVVNEGVEVSDNNAFTFVLRERGVDKKEKYNIKTACVKNAFCVGTREGRKLCEVGNGDLKVLRKVQGIMTCSSSQSSFEYGPNHTIFATKSKEGFFPKVFAVYKLETQKRGRPKKLKPQP